MRVHNVMCLEDGGDDHGGFHGFGGGKEEYLGLWCRV